MRRIHQRKIGINRSLPAAPCACVARGPSATQIRLYSKALPPICRRRGRQRKIVLAKTVADGDIHLAQSQWRCAAFFVYPQHAPALHRKRREREKPIRRRLIAFFAQTPIDAADKNAPHLVAPQHQIGCHHRHPICPQTQERAGRDSGLHQRQRQRHAALLVIDAQASNRQFGQQSIAGLHAINAHGQAQFAAGHLLHLPLVLGNMRRQIKIQAQPDQDQTQQP